MAHINSITEAEAELNRLYGQYWHEQGQGLAWEKVVPRHDAKPVAPATSGWQARNRARAAAWEADRRAKR